MATITHGTAVPGFTIPRRKESYTTWLYLGLAIAVATLTFFGMWYAGLPRAMP